MPDRLERDGVGLYFQHEGAGDPAYVFVHGWCCDHTFFQPQFDHFKTDHTVMALDLRGCGCSDKPEGGYDIPTMADDVAWLSEQLGLVKPIVVGHSMGALIALELAARDPLRPGAIVAVDPGPIHPTPESRSFYAGFADQLEGPNGEVVRRVYVENMLPPQDTAWSRKVLDTMTSTPMDVALATFRNTLEWNGVGALGLCMAPLLLIRARLGGGGDPSRLLAIKPDMHVGVTVGAGHFHQLEVPQQINAMIERFTEIVTEPGRVGTDG